jgi:hypothetical protein
MEVTYDWIIKNMNTKLSDDGLVNVVVSVNWEIIGKTTVNDKEYVSAYSGTVGMALPGEQFTPYQDLTQEQVLNWVWSRGINKAEAEAYIAGQLQQQINPPVIVLPNPWE